MPQLFSTDNPRKDDPAPPRKDQVAGACTLAAQRFVDNHPYIQPDHARAAFLAGAAVGIAAVNHPRMSDKARIVEYLAGKAHELLIAAAKAITKAGAE